MNNSNQTTNRMGTYRVLKDVYSEIKAIDANTAITRHGLRQLVLDAEAGKNKEIKIIRMGAKRLICLESVLEFFGIERRD